MIQDISNPFMATAVSIALIIGILAEIAIAVALVYSFVNIIKGILIRRSQKGMFF